jgi:hypothetical protein
VAGLTPFGVFGVPSFHEVLLGGGCENKLLFAFGANKELGLEPVSLHNQMPPLY